MATDGTLLFDGDCGFCTWVVGKVRRLLKPKVELVPWQKSNLDDLGVTAMECAESIQFVSTEGGRTKEGRAVAQLLKVSRRPWPILGSIVDLPLVINLANVTYRIVARNRFRLPGSTPACQLDHVPRPNI